MPGARPSIYYLHAMSDLRMARAYLARPDYEPVASDERRAVAEIDAALDEMRRAAIEDSKNPWQGEPPDANLPASDRFHKAMSLLDSARRDASHAEDDPGCGTCNTASFTTSTKRSAPLNKRWPTRCAKSLFRI